MWTSQTIGLGWERFPGGSQLLLMWSAVLSWEGLPAQCAECSHTLLTSSFWPSSVSLDNRQQVLGLMWRAMFTLYSGAALSVLYWMTPRCLQQSESLPFLKRGLPATTSCGAFQRGNVGKLFYPLVKKSNRKITIILMSPRNAYYS